MLDMGFIDDVEEILGHIFTTSKLNLIRKKKDYLFIYFSIDLDRQTKPQFIVFSATMPTWVHKTTKKYMTKDFITVDLVKGNTQKTCANVEVKLYSFPFWKLSFFLISI